MNRLTIGCLGVLFFTLAYSCQPFFCTDDIIHQRFVKRPTVRSLMLEDLLGRMLDPNPDTRITIGEINVDPFLTNESCHLE